MNLVYRQTSLPACGGFPHGRRGTVGRRRCRAAGVVVQPLMLAVAASATGHAQYPARPVMITVPFPSGGSADITSRIIAQKLSESWGHQVVVENEPGAGGNIGTAEVAKAAADGHRLVVATNGSMAVNPSLYRKLPYDPVRDFQPITLIAIFPLIMVVHPSVPARSLKALIALAKSRPGQLYYGSGGNDTQGHLSGELLRSLAQIDIVHVPYKGSTAAITDLISGQISLLFSGVPAIKQHVYTGKLHALAMADGRRTRAMPETLSAAEAELPGLEVTFWLGILAPAGTPPPVIVEVHDEIERIIRLPDVNSRLAALGAEPMTTTPEEFAALIARENPKYAKIVHEAGMRID